MADVAIDSESTSTIRARWAALRRTLRFRTTAAAVLVMAAGLIVAAVALDVVLGVQLSRAFDRQLETQATDRARLVGVGADLGSVVSAIGDEEFVVVLAPDGTVVDAVGLADPAAVASIEVGVAVDAELEVIETYGEAPEVERETIRVFAAPVPDIGGVVVVGTERGAGFDPREGTRQFLAAGVVLLILGVAWTLWRSVGQALRPVETLRSEVDSIAGSGTGERVGAEGNGDELEALAFTMNQLLDRVDAQAVAQRRFVADASHELKSPVANLRATVETVVPPIDEGQWRVVGGTLLDEASRLQALIDDLLFLARVDERGAAPVVERVALDDIVFDEFERLARTHADVRLDASSVAPVVVDGDQRQLTRLVRNLTENAARHATGVVSVALSTNGSSAVLVVADDGPGIAPADRERVLDRFVRLDDARTRASGGSGLGLSIVSAIVEGHDGLLDLGDAPGGGLVMTVTLPVD